MQTADSSNLFQTSDQIAKEDARQLKSILAAKIGDPIIIPSKVIGLEVRGDDAWIAESGWIARRLDLKTGKTKRLFKGHGGPCTCLALLDVPGASKTVLFTGSWDKTIKAWNAESGALLSTTAAHTDFLKCLLIIPHLSILLSSSSDKFITAWDLSPYLLPAPSEGYAALKKLGSIKEHTRPVECLIMDPASVEKDFVVFYSSDSMGVILQWQLSILESRHPKFTRLAALPGHSTSVPTLHLTPQGLFSGSVDSNVLFHPLPLSSPPKEPSPIPHPYYIKSLLVLPSSFHPSHPVLLTGSTDEHIRVFDVSPILDSAEGRGEAREMAQVEGHFHEITAMKPWIKDGPDGKEAWVVSCGLDATIRRWSMKDILNPPKIPQKRKEKKELGGMTEEEERELAELMDDDE